MTIDGFVVDQKTVNKKSTDGFSKKSNKESKGTIGSGVMQKSIITNDKINMISKLNTQSQTPERRAQNDQPDIQDQQEI